MTPTFAPVNAPPIVGRPKPRRSSGEVAAADGILDCIGDTPLVRFRRYLDNPDVEFYVKLESANPGGSAKDRPAKRMLAELIQRERLSKGCTIVESSSGNMGIGLAQACRFYGFRFICVVDPHAQPQNVAIMKALGAEVVRVENPCDGSFLAARLARVQQILKAIDNSYWPNQYANQQNPMAHQAGTMEEIDRATEGKLDYLFVATSSTGTAQGCRDYIKQRNLPTKVVAVDALGSVLFGGSPGKRLIPGLGAGHEPALARNQTFDHVVRISDLNCVVGCRRAADLEATLVGGSAGGVLEVVRAFEHQIVGKRCVAILHDSGTRYLDTVFSDDWVQGSLGLSVGELNAAIRKPPRLPSHEA